MQVSPLHWHRALLCDRLVVEVIYKTRTLQRVCTDAQEARRKYGARMAKTIFMRVTELGLAKSVEELLHFHVGRCHALKGDRQGQFAMDLVHPYRLVFERLGDVVQIARIVEIADYH